MTEPQSIQIKATAYFARNPEARTRREREEFLGALGVEHPGHFLSSVWTPAWEEAVDAVLDPDSNSFRPLSPTDFHFKWAVGAVNLLPRQARLNILHLKMKPAGLEAALTELLAKGGYPAADFVVEDVEVLRSIHAEYAIKLRTADARQLRVEVSHYLPAAEEIFHHFAERLHVPVATVQVAQTPAGKKFVMELSEPDHVELTEAPRQRLASFGDKIIQHAALHDAVGDVLGTIMRDPHYLLGADGELLSFHHYQLFMELDNEQFGFFLPVFVLLGEELGREREWFAKYSDAYVREFSELQARSDEILQMCQETSEIINEYLGDSGELSGVCRGIRERLSFDPKQRVATIGELFCKQSS